MPSPCYWCIFFRLGRQLTAYARKDSAPSWVRPIPISILYCHNVISQGGTTRQQAIAYLTCITFFFLLRPLEYYQGGTDTVLTPFCLQYIQLYADENSFPATITTPYSCAAIFFVRILFATEENGFKGESIGNGNNGHPHECTVSEIRRHVAHLQKHDASSRTPVALVSKNGKCSTIRSIYITKSIQ